MDRLPFRALHAAWGPVSATSLSVTAPGIGITGDERHDQPERQQLHADRADAEGGLFEGRQVNEVMDLDDRDVSPPPELGTGIQIDYLKGMGRAGKEFVLLIDLDAALSNLEQSRVHQLAQPPATSQQTH